MFLLPLLFIYQPCISQHLVNTRPILGQHIDQVLVDILVEIVSTDTTYSKHDPNYLPPVTNNQGILAKGETTNISQK